MPRACSPTPTPGTNPALLLRRGGACERLETPPVGIISALPAAQSSVQLGAGDWLAIFSDGITEAANAEGEKFGRDRVATAITMNRSRTAEEMRDAVLAELKSHSRGVVQADDVTLITAHVL